MSEPLLASRLALGAHKGNVGSPPSSLSAQPPPTRAPFPLSLANSLAFTSSPTPSRGIPFLRLSVSLPIPLSGNVHCFMDSTPCQRN